MQFQEIDIREIKENAIRLIRDEWALITAGDQKKWNTMTVSWGGIGELWGKDVAMIFIRPQRYTYEFIEREDYFTMSFFEKEYKKALSLCGSKSGRDIDKAKEAGLTPLFSRLGCRDRRGKAGIYLPESRVSRSRPSWVS